MLDILVSTDGHQLRNKVSRKRNLVSGKLLSFNRLAFICWPHLLPCRTILV